MKKKTVKHRIISFLLLCVFVVFPLSTFMSVLTYGFETFAPTITSLYTEGMELIADINENTFAKREDTRIYDKNGELIKEINVTNYKYVPIEDISPYLYEAYIAMEDQNFMTHNGLDPKAIFRAAVSLVIHHGEITQGGSTITQQVIKNCLLQDKGRVERKIMEIFMAPELEKRLSKDDIMEAYCNTNYYANNCYGVETASLYYYGKHASELTLGEAATLTGISNWPSEYDPKAHPENALKKRNTVLNTMLDFGSISVPEYLMARREVPEYVFHNDQRESEDYLTSYAIHCATESLMESRGFVFQYQFENEQEYKDYQSRYTAMYDQIASDIRLGGYTIYTSLDPTLQNELQYYLDNSVSEYQEKNSEGIYALQSAATVVDNKTGFVVAIVGGRSGSGEFNRGYQAVRQPGSAIKPILDYGPAFDSGKYYPSKQIEDSPIKNGPHNSYAGYKGLMSIQEAIARSCNTIAYKTLQDIGVSYGLTYLDKMEFSHLSYLDNGNNSLAIGGFTNGVTVAEMAKAYATIASGGTYTDNTCIQKIEFMKTGIIFEEDSKKTEVYSVDTSYMLMDCLKDVLSSPFGTGRSRQLNNAIAGAKTGTTDESKDVWFCGSTKYYSVAVWCGYDLPRGNSGISGATHPGYTWQKIMEYLHQDLAISDFDRPETVVDKQIDYRGDPVSYYTGQTGLFSTIAEQRAAEEAKRIAEEKERQRQQQIQTSFDKIIQDLEKIEFTSYNQVPEIDAMFSEAWALIEQVSDETAKEQDKEQLNELYHKIYQTGELVYEKGSKFFWNQAAPERVQSLVKNALSDMQNFIEQVRTLESQIQSLELIQSITEENYTSIQESLNYTKDLFYQYSDGLNNTTIATYYAQYSRINDLLAEFKYQQEQKEKQEESILEDPEKNTEGVEKPAIEPESPLLPNDGEDDKDENDTDIDSKDPEIVDYAKRMIEFLASVQPNDTQLDQYITDAEVAVQKCQELPQYAELLQSLQTEIDRLRNNNQ